MNIAVIDQTVKWSGLLPTIVDRWNDRLAVHGRLLRLVYQRGTPQSCGARIDGAIVVCDSEHSAGEFGEGGYDYDYRPWKWGYVSLYLDPAGRTELALALGAHEIGHTLGLNHVVDGSNSVMTTHISLSTPTAYDCANVLPYLDTEPPAPVPPAPPQKKKRHRRKH